VRKSVAQAELGGVVKRKIVPRIGHIAIVWGYVPARAQSIDVFSAHG
jgi:hypothetical protein